MNADYYTYVGLDFVDENKIRFTSIQLVEKSTKNAVAIADFTDSKLGRHFGCFFVNMAKFLADAKTLLENSTPITFHGTNLLNQNL